MPGPARRQAQGAALPLPSPGARRGLPKYSDPLARLHAGRCAKPRFLSYAAHAHLMRARAQRRTPPVASAATPHSAATRTSASHVDFQPFLAVPGGDGPARSASPQNNQRRRPHRNAAANCRTQNALCRALPRSCRAGRKNPKKSAICCLFPHVPQRAKRCRSATQTAACAFQHRRRRKTAGSIPLLIYRYSLH